ncbi:Putative spermidine/putrescine transport system substrate-binding protein [Hyphomicrobiales bacterium]|nr:Putative spermidine/putrescine transport system substrate-binding protein [Hyphomicrobiales bacterium]CAH1689318.1 putative spermidine/putrescine transport system substrate-binding protein [Hyphomicrobiales bacterium]
MGNTRFSSIMNRRSFLEAAGAATVTIGFGAPAQAQAKEFVSTVFGGVYEREYRKHIIEPFEKETGIKVLTKTGLSSEWLTNSIVNRRSPEIDLLLLPYPDSIKATTEGLGLPLSVADIPNIAQIAPEWYDQYDRAGIGLDYVGYGIAYREDLVPTPPKSWQDLWNPAYKGKVTAPEIGQWGSWELLVMAARLNGGSEDKMEPAFAALKRLKPNIKQFFKSGVDIANLLGSGEAWVCGMTTNIPAYGLIDAGKPVKFIYPSEGAMAGAVSYHIAKNSKNADACKKFINFALGKEVQENFCNGVVAAPTNVNAVVNERTRQRVPSREHLLLFSWAKIIPQMSELADRWNQEVAF